VDKAKVILALLKLPCRRGDRNPVLSQVEVIFSRQSRMVGTDESRGDVWAGV
jgi:hypothetical protein